MEKRDSENNIVIDINELVKNFEGFEAVRGVTFSVYAGECLGLLGPNGAGKTTIVKMIYDFSPITAGELRVFGESIVDSARRIKARIGIVPQEDNLDPELTVLENLLVYAGYFRMNRRLAAERAQEILDFMDLSEKADAIVNNLSGGMKRRLTLGRALLNRPELLILDEPTTGLDPYARHMLWQRLRKLKDTGTTMLLTTHYLEEASQLCDRLVILHRGKVIETGGPQELMDRYVGKEVLEMGLSTDDLSALMENSGDLIKDHQKLGDYVLFFTNAGEELSEFMSVKTKSLDVQVNYRRLRPSTLEDVFFKLTGESLGD